MPGGGAVVAQHALELCAEPGDGGTAALVASVGADGHAVHLPHLEGVRQQQQFRLGVHGGALYVGA